MDIENFIADNAGGKEEICFLISAICCIIIISLDQKSFIWVDCIVISNWFCLIMCCIDLGLFAFVLGID